MPDSCADASTRRSGNLLRLFLERGIAVEGERCEKSSTRPATSTTPPVSYDDDDDDDDKLSRIVVLVRLVVIMEQLHTPQQPSLQLQIAG
jgi:hypothetical protein